MKSFTFTKSFISIIIVWVLLIVGSMLFDNIIMIGLTLFYTGIIPFLLTVFWISLSETGVLLRKHLTAWHWTVVTSWLIFFYSLYAKKWTAATINGIFHVDPEKFSITYNFLAFAYAPTSILYQPSLVSGLLNIFTALVTGLAPLIVFSLFTEIKIKTIAKWSALLLCCIYLVSFFLTTAENISKNVNNVALSFALWADFNEKHTCTDNWVAEATGVIFLDGEKVLAYFPKNTNGKHFEVKTCNLQKTF